MFSQGKMWRDFPYGLLDCQDIRSFSQKYEKFLLPVVLWFGKFTTDEGDEDEHHFVTEKLRELSAEVGKEVRQLLIDNFSELVPFFLPTFVAPENASFIFAKISRADAIHHVSKKITDLLLVF